MNACATTLEKIYDDVTNKVRVTLCPTCGTAVPVREGTRPAADSAPTAPHIVRTI